MRWISVLSLGAAIGFGASCTTETRTTVLVAAEDRVRVEAGSFYWRIQGSERYEAASLADGPRQTGEVELPQALSLVPEGGDPAARAELEVGLLGGASGLEILASTVTDVRFVEGRHLRRELRLGESACLLDFICCRDGAVTLVDQADFCAPRRCLGLGPDEELCAADTGAFRCEGGQCIPVGACEEGERRSCGGPPDGDPACLGETLCVDGQFGPCEGAARTPAATETCGDGVDDDCDLRVDEGCPDEPGELGEPVVEPTGETVSAFTPVVDAWGLRLASGPPGELAMVWLQSRTFENVLSVALLDPATLTDISQATQSGGEVGLPPDIVSRSDDWVYAFETSMFERSFDAGGFPGPSIPVDPPGIVTDLAVRDDGAVFYAAEVGGCEVEVAGQDEMVTATRFQTGAGARFGKVAATSDGFVAGWLQWIGEECSGAPWTVQVQELGAALQAVGTPPGLPFTPSVAEADAFDLAARGNQVAVCVGTASLVSLAVLEGGTILRTSSATVGPTDAMSSVQCRVDWLGDAVVGIGWRETDAESWVVGLLWRDDSVQSFPLAMARTADGVRHTLADVEVLPGGSEVAFVWSVLEGENLSFEGARLRFE